VAHPYENRTTPLHWVEDILKQEIDMQTVTMETPVRVVMGDPEVAPDIPPEVPQPDMPTGIPPQGPPETSPEPPPEITPGQPAEIPDTSPGEI